MSNPSIIVKNLAVKLGGNTVLDDISFELEPQQHLAITGESGSGKTTLAKALSGKVFHAGTIHLSSSETTATRRVVFVEQQDHFKNLSNQSSFYYQQRYNSTEAEDAATVEQELERISLAVITESNERRNRIQEVLERFNLSYRRHTPLLQLSNGEHKRFQLVSAFLHQPQVLILDQPFIGLDVKSREALHTVINELAVHTAIIIITSIGEVPACITHIAELSKGKLKSFSKKNQFQHKIAQPILFANKPIPHTKERTDFTNAIAIKNTSVQYGEKVILNNINWQVARGEKWLLKGPNGAGKSTLLSLLTGDNPQAYANEIYLFDKRRGSGESIWDIKKNIGYISPEVHMYFDRGLSCYHAVASGFFDTMGLYRALSTAQEQVLAQWLAYFDLKSVQHKPLSSLSSGMQRLVLLARALVKNPPLLILDEPCQGLDDQLTQEFNSLIDELCVRANKTLIYVSHYDGEIPSCIDKKLELNNGHAVISNRNIKQIIAA